ncbi:MAG: hypothetical protein AAFU78_10655 [Cyanobacteria bacterium J06633_2]
MQAIAIHDSFKRQLSWEDNPRQVALSAPLNHYPDHPQVLTLLRDRAENDPDEALRQWAQRQIKWYDSQTNING